MKCSVKPYGDDGYTFLVASRSRQGDHLVVLTDYDLLGSCACEDFRLRKLQAFRIEREVSDEHRCAHIIAAREYLLTHILRKLKDRRKLSSGKARQEGEEVRRPKEEREAKPSI